MSAGGGADFASYVAARWPALVRTLVLLGQTPAEADAVAREGLARCAGGFAAARRDGDLDVRVYATVLAARAARHPEPDDGAGVVDPTITDLEDRAERLAGLVAELARMPEPERSAVVLRHVAELDAAQVGDVLGAAPEVVAAATAVGPSAADLRHAGAAVPVRPAPVEAVAARVRARRRQRWRRAAAAGAGFLVVVGVATWFGTRADPPDLPDAEVRTESNAANVPWYANGVLHLPRVAVDLTQAPPLQQVVQVPDGVVVTDQEGAVILVDQLGRLTMLGRTGPGDRIAAWTERGWVAWVDVSEGRDLVVRDTLGGVEVSRREAEPGLKVVAVDQERVYYNLGEEPWSWRVPDENPGREPGGGPLADVSSAVRVTAVGKALLMISQPLFDVQVTVPGRDAVLSPDGDFVLARVDDARPDELRVYEAADGTVVDPHLGEEEDAVAAAFGPDHTLTYVASVGEKDSETGPRLLRTCDLDTDTCETVTEFSNERGVPLLPS